MRHTRPWRTTRLDLPRFTLIGATTRAGQLSAPLRDRFGVTLRLELYTPEELSQIITRSAAILNVDIVPEGAYEIARRSRGTPRIANRMLRRVRDFAQVKADGVITKDVADQALCALEIDRHHRQGYPHLRRPAEGLPHRGAVHRGGRRAGPGHPAHPGVAWVTVDEGADAGIVISASHNPFEHNGIKIFNGQGFKLSDELEEKIEEIVLFGHNDVPRKTHGEIGKVSYVAPKASEDYIDHLESTIDSTLGGLRILVDCANGASYTTAARLFDRFPKLRTDVINADPDGVNINDKCGSTHIDSLAAMVKAGGMTSALPSTGTPTAVWRWTSRGT